MKTSIYNTNIFRVASKDGQRGGGGRNGCSRTRSHIGLTEIMQMCSPHSGKMDSKKKSDPTKFPWISDNLPRFPHTRFPNNQYFESSNGFHDALKVAPNPEMPIYDAASIRLTSDHVANHKIPSFNANCLSPQKQNQLISDHSRTPHVGPVSKRFNRLFKSTQLFCIADPNFARRAFDSLSTNPT